MFHCRSIVVFGLNVKRKHVIGNTPIHSVKNFRHRATTQLYY